VAKPLPLLVQTPWRWVRGSEESAVKRSTVSVIAFVALLSTTVSPRLLAQHAAVAPEPDASSAATAQPDASSVDPNDTEWTRWTSGRYRITPGDVLELTFPFVPELTQTVTVQPDGYVSLKELPDMRIQGRTVAQVNADLLDAYGRFVRDPVLTVTLKEFQQPYFIAGGDVTKPGRYELRGPTTMSEAIALAGGPIRGANMSNVVLFRRTAGEQLETKQVNVRRMYARHDLSEDVLQRPGDILFVPKGVLGKLQPMLDLLRFSIY
jgi:polysaccharide export outer membrane protein